MDGKIGVFELIAIIPLICTLTLWGQCSFHFTLEFLQDVQRQMLWLMPWWPQQPLLNVWRVTFFIHNYLQFPLSQWISLIEIPQRIVHTCDCSFTFELRFSFTSPIFVLLLFSCSVAKTCQTLWLHGLQHTRLVCLPPSPGVS